MISETSETIIRKNKANIKTHNDNFNSNANSCSFRHQKDMQVLRHFRTYGDVSI